MSQEKVYNIYVALISCNWLWLGKVFNVILTTKFLNKSLLLQHQLFKFSHSIILIGWGIICSAKPVFGQNSEGVIPALQNTLAWIHPFTILLFYSTVFFFSQRPADRLGKLILHISLLGCLLGGVWAYQELNWGGWWNWDFVELPLALLISALLQSFHNIVIFSRVRNKHVHTFIQNNLLFWITFTQLSTQSSIHSFVVTAATYSHTHQCLIAVSYGKFLLLGLFCFFKKMKSLKLFIWFATFQSVRSFAFRPSPQSTGLIHLHYMYVLLTISLVSFNWQNSNLIYKSPNLPLSAFRHDKLFWLKSLSKYLFNKYFLLNLKVF